MMVTYTATIKKFAEKGEKTGWSYIEIPEEIAIQIKPNNKKSFRVKGKLDQYSFEGVSLLPMGEGDFIMPLNGTVRKAIRKEKGASVKVQLAEDKKEKKISVDLLACMEDESEALEYFNSLPKSHQKYYSNWIEAAKTDATKAKRIAQAIKAFSLKLSYGEMIRANKKDSLL